MSQREQLKQYIAQVRRRLRLDAGLRGAAAIALIALVATVLLTIILNAYAFPEGGLAPARVVLLAIVIGAVCFGVAWPLWRLTVRNSVARAERRFPEFEQRLVTFHEKENAAEVGAADPNAALFQELLAADTLKVAETAQPATLAPKDRMLWMVGAGAACLAVLVWLIAARPGFIGYGASLLWTGPHKDVPPIYQINVKPGDAAVRRNSDAMVTAQVVGLETNKVNLYARYGAGAKWEQVAMQPVEDGSGFQFLFAGLPENVEYYVQAGAATSKHFKFRVVDLPSVKTMAVTYHYPKWTGMEDVSEEQAGDLRAIEGTDAALTVTMSAPLKDGMLVLDDGQTVKLMPGTAAEGANVYHATIHMAKDGAYHVAGADEGQQVRLSEDYFIATNKANPPRVAISRPGGDYRASPIEEVTVGVNAGADFGLKSVALHYSVNGGPEKTVDVLKKPGAKDASGTATLSLEDFKLQPGDVISLYATAEDAHADAKTDIGFIQVDPFEREFSQSQQGGGGGGGGGGNAQNQTDISRREKELIAETFKQMNAKGVKPEAASAEGKLLSDAQAALRQQAEALSARMQTRDLSQANEEFNSFDKDMQDAANGMQPAADKLKAQQWQQAMPLEQKVLQALLRAEATFRQIQVAFGRRGGGGGGGGGSGRDLASLFDLEMDTEKNQYETAQTASPQEQQQKKVDDALAKLDALAKRQEELAQNQGTMPPTFQERWQQEMLRREAEQLQREMEQMQSQQGEQGQQSGQQQAGQQSGQEGQQSGQQQGQSGQQSASQQGGQQSASAAGPPRSGRQGTQDGNADPRVAQALQRLRAANDAMGQAGQQQNAQQSADAAKRAADRLREATDLLGGAQSQQANGRLDQLGRKADQLTREEASQADRVKKLAAQGQAMQSKMNGGGSPGADEMASAEKERQSLANDRQQMSGDLEQLERQMRDAARDMAPTQPGAASSLRDALNGLDQKDLTNLVQRTADWLREGVNPNSNGTENEIASGLKKLDDQVHKAQQQAGSEQQSRPGQDANGTQTAALGQVDRLRNQIESLQLGRGNQQGQNQDQRNGQQGQQGQSGRGAGQQANGQQPGNPRGQGSQLSQMQGQGQRGGQNGRSGQQGQQQAQNGQGGGQGGRGGNAQQAGNNSNGAQNGAGGARNGQQRGGNDQRPQQFGDGPLRGGGGSQIANLNVDLGGQQFSGTRDPNAPRLGQNPADRQRVIEQGLGELGQLRQEAKGNAQAQKDIDALQEEMKKLDPSRFQGNPEVVAALHQKVLNDVDKLELELRRDPSQPQSGEARTSAAAKVPPGYEESVAEYYRRLGKGQ